MFNILESTFDQLVLTDLTSFIDAGMCHLANTSHANRFYQDSPIHTKVPYFTTWRVFFTSGLAPLTSLLPPGLVQSR